MKSRILEEAIAAAVARGDQSEAAFLRRLDDGRGGVKPFPVLAGPESVVALPPPREIPETVRGLVRRHGRRG